MKQSLTSRERMLFTMEFKETDYVPCSFMMFHGLRDRCGKDPFKFVESQLALGLDAVVELPELPIGSSPEVETKMWKEENVPGQIYPLLHKKYSTPAGMLHTVVRKTEDWNHGDEIELYSDFNVPRSIRYHVNGRPDLKSFRYLLAPPTMAEVKQYREESAKLKLFASDRGLLVRGVRGVLIDAAIRFAGVQNLVFAAIEDPGYLEEFFSIINDWNMLRMEIALDEKPDLFLRRAWYENMSFWSPDMFRRFMLPPLEKEILWAHQAGAKYGYLNTCSYMGLLDDFIKAGMDVLIGVDPVQDNELDMDLLKKKSYGRFCLWGGGNGFVTVELGTPEDIRKEVLQAMDKLAPGGGFILSPVDNVREPSDQVMSNAKVFIDTWKETRDADYFAKKAVACNA